PPPSLHLGPPGVAAAAGDGGERAEADPGHAAVAPAAAVGLPLPPPLSACDGHLPEGPARVRPGTRPARAPHGLPPGRGLQEARSRADRERHAAGDRLAMAVEELLKVEDLEKHFPVTRGVVFQKEIG